jgi:hypothetical protein
MMDKIMATRLAILRHAAQTVVAFLFVLWHGYLVLIVYAEAMVNEPIRAGTRFALTVQVGLGSAVLISLLLLVGSIVGWQSRILFLLGALLTLAWALTFWLM